MTTAATFHHQRPMASTSYLPPAPAMNGHVEHSAAASAEDDSKISAFCALEFPYYNFYIKTRSVTIGRLAPMVVPAAHCTANPSRASPAISTKAVTAENSFISPRLQPVSATRSTSAGPTEAKDEPMEPESVVEKKARSRSVTPSDPPPAYSAQAPLQKAKMEQELQSVPPSEDPNVHVDVDLGPIKAVSRDHARCFFHNGWNCWALEVRGRNGLVVEGRWRAKGDVIALTHRTKIQIAEHIFYFVLPDSVLRQPTRQSSFHSSEESSSDGEVKISDEEDLESIADGPTQATTGLPDKRLAHDHEIELLELNPTSSANKTQTVTDGKAQVAASVSPNRTSPVIGGSPPKTAAATKKQQSKPAVSTSTAQKAATKPAKPPVKRTKGKRRLPPPDGDDMVIDANTYTIWPLRKPTNEYVDGSIKPPYSFPSLIGQCMHYNSDKKLTSAVIQDWIANVYPWYDANRDKVGWLNSVQQHLSTNKGFVKTPRRSDEPGKGNFWVYDESVGLVFDGISEDEDDDGSPAKPASVPVQKKPPVRAAPAKATPKQSLKITTAKATPQTGKAPDKVAVAPAANGPSKTTAPANATPVASTSARPMPSSTVQPVASTSAGPAQRPNPQASTPAQPGAQPKQVNVHPVKILVGPIPPTYKPPAPQPTNTATDEVAAQLLKDPPIVLHEGTLILAPAIFGQMKPEQITQLSRLGATKALSILQSYIVQHFKEKLKRSKKAATPPVRSPNVQAQPAPPSAKRKLDEGSTSEQPAKKAAV